MTWLCISSADVRAQGVLEIRKIDVTFVVPPKTVDGDRAGPIGRQQKWLQIEAEYDVRDTREEWLDELQFRYFVLMGSGTSQKLFTGEVAYVNVPRQSGQVSVMYVHPDTVRRFSNGELPSKVAVQMLYKDRPMMQLSWPNQTRDRWWETFFPVKGYVLSPDRTPFANINYDRTNQIKEAPTTP